MPLMRVLLTELPDFAADFVSHLPQETGSRAYVVGLSGPLGAGKTAFVQEVARALGVTETVPSPTFIITRSYPIFHSTFKRLVHIDAYRLSPTESGTIDWEGYLDSPENLILVEWPENLRDTMPAGVRMFEFQVVGEQERDIVEV